MKNKKDRIYIIATVLLAIFCIVIFAVKIATMTQENHSVTGSELLGEFMPSSYDMDTVCTGVKDDKLETLPYLYDFDDTEDSPSYTEMALTDETKYFTETRISAADGSGGSSIEYKSLTKSEFLKLFVENDRQHLYIWSQNGTDCDAVMAYFEVTGQG